MQVTDCYQVSDYKAHKLNSPFHQKQETEHQNVVTLICYIIKNLGKMSHMQWDVAGFYFENVLKNVLQLIMENERQSLHIP